MIKATKASNIIIRVPQKMRRMPARKTSSSGQPSRWALVFPSLAVELFFSASHMGCQTMRPLRLLTCSLVPGAGLGGGDHLERVHQPRCPNRGGRRIFPVVKRENKWHLQSFRWDKRPTAFLMASNGTLFCSTILWCSKRWSAKKASSNPKP